MNRLVVFFLAWLLAQKSVPLLSPQGEFEGMTLRDTLLWLVSPGAYWVAFWAIATIALLNIWFIRRLSYTELAGSALVSGGVFAWALFPYEKLAPESLVTRMVCVLIFALSPAILYFVKRAVSEISPGGSKAEA